MELGTLLAEVADYVLEVTYEDVRVNALEVLGDRMSRQRFNLFDIRDEDLCA